MSALELRTTNLHLLSEVSGRDLYQSEAEERCQQIKYMQRNMVANAWKIGQYASELKNNGGWKVLGYRSWESCCKDEFNAIRQSVDRFMNFYETKRDLPADDQEILTLESHTRPLAGLKPKEVQEVLREVRKDARLDHHTGKPRITAALIQQKRDAIHPQERQVRTAAKPSPEPAQLVLVVEETEHSDKPDVTTEHEEIKRSIDRVLVELDKILHLRRDGLYTRSETNDLLKPIGAKLAAIYE